MKRPTWNEYFMEMTRITSKRSTCRQVAMGAILVRDRRVLTTGYNGSPKGFPHCTDIGCLREEKGLKGDEHLEVCRGLHAIQNAIIQGAVFGIAIDGATLYTTHPPCITCTKMLINAGIKKIITERDYSRPMSTSASIAFSMIKEAGIEFVVFGTKQRNE